jgi:hypothetical protein
MVRLKGPFGAGSVGARALAAALILRTVAVIGLGDAALLGVLGAGLSHASIGLLFVLRAGARAGDGAD